MSLPPPRFATRDPSTPAFWSERYAADFMPWDQAGIPADLTQALHRDGLPSPPARVLLPGCGVGYELPLLLERGYDACAIDISPQAIARVHGLAPSLRSYVRLADAFALAADPAWQAWFDWIYERAFVCALPARLWPAWASAVAALCKPGGILAGVFFLDAAAATQAASSRRGPPFAMTEAELHALLSPTFTCVHAHAVTDDASISVFRGKEWWMEWRRQA